jgi:uncharacterized cupredoxin-like copper-binding protein
MGRRVGLVTALAVLALVATGCSGEDSTATPSAEPGIATTLKDFSIKPAETEAPAGSVTFDLVNDGPSDHTFYVVRTDLAEDALPVQDHLVRLDELEIAAEVDEVPFGDERSLTVELATGDYVMLCSIAGHYESDMHSAFTVT